MKKTLSAILIFMLIAITVTSLYGCGKDKESYPDVPLSAFTDKFTSVIPNPEKFSAVDDSYLQGMFEIDPASVDEYAVYVQTMSNEIDQYGIFKVSDQQKLGDTAAAIQKYIDTIRENWANFNYLPEETVKLDAAKVAVKGNYILFTIMSEENQNKVTGAFNEVLGIK